MLLKDKIAIITGGAGGIGLTASRIFAENGATVIMFDVVEKAGIVAEKELTDKGYSVKFIKTDISDEKQVIAAMKIIDQTFGKVDILYNSVGFSRWRQR